MFGKNKIRPLETNPDTLQVAEIFPTIQGEGPWSGYPAVFVRLSGCNLRCWFCDTKWDDEKDKYMTVHEICQAVGDAYSMYAVDRRVKARVVLTGGEPARQNCDLLVDKLIEAGFGVQIETAGTFWAEWLRKVRVVISPKTKFVHPKFREIIVDWKYVIRAGEVSDLDGLPNDITQQQDPSTLSSGEFMILADKYGCPARPVSGDEVWLSPCNEYDEEKNKANREAVAKSCMQFGYRAQVQLHNLLDLP